MLGRSLIVILVLAFARTAPAEIDVAGGAKSPIAKAVHACEEKFAAAGGDPEGAYERMKRGKYSAEVVSFDGEPSRTNPTEPLVYQRHEPTNSRITWDPKRTTPYQDGTPRDPCAALYHELVHADDISKGAEDTSMCGTTGIQINEVKATLAENRYRKAHQLPARKHFADKPLPASMEACTSKKKHR
jgi:hypothetical protein